MVADCEQRLKGGGDEPATEMSFIASNQEEINMYSQNDTIAAIATPLGIGGVGIVRISGEKSQKLYQKYFLPLWQKKKVPDFKPNKVYHGWIVNNGNPVDEVIVLCFKAPNSYTGEMFLKYSAMAELM